jgi:hypothetical protein
VPGRTVSVGQTSNFHTAAAVVGLATDLWRDGDYQFGNTGDQFIHNFTMVLFSDVSSYVVPLQIFDCCMLFVCLLCGARLLAVQINYLTSLFLSCAPHLVNMDHVSLDELNDIVYKTHRITASFGRRPHCGHWHVRSGAHSGGLRPHHAHHWYHVVFMISD